MLFRYGNPELHQVAILFTDIKQPNRFSRRWMASRLAGTFASDPGALRRRSLRSQVSARWRTIADRTTRVSTCTWSNRWNPTFYWRCWPGWHRGAAVKRTRLDGEHCASSRSHTFRMARSVSNQISGMCWLCDSYLCCDRRGACAAPADLQVPTGQATHSRGLRCWCHGWW
jgi:hypothetical protein